MTFGWRPMFTGIVEGRGTVRTAGRRLVVDCGDVARDAAIGASIAVNGVCLTVVDRDADALAFDLSEETLARTGLGRLAEGDGVNLERPMAADGRFGGHIVQGHVDGVGSVKALTADAGGGATLDVEVPAALRRYLVEKGSVTVDGVSLTVATVLPEGFRIALIPHTLSGTTLGALRTGDAVNLEVDVIAKYVEALVEGRKG